MFGLNRFGSGPQPQPATAVVPAQNSTTSSIDFKTNVKNFFLHYAPGIQQRTKLEPTGDHYIRLLTTALEKLGSIKEKIEKSSKESAADQKALDACKLEFDKNKETIQELLKGTQAKIEILIAKINQKDTIAIKEQDLISVKKIAEKISDNNLMQNITDRLKKEDEKQALRKQRLHGISNIESGEQSKLGLLALHKQITQNFKEVELLLSKNLTELKDFKTQKEFDGYIVQFNKWNEDFKEKQVQQTAILNEVMGIVTHPEVKKNTSELVTRFENQSNLRKIGEAESEKKQYLITLEEEITGISDSKLKKEIQDKWGKFCLDFADIKCKEEFDVKFFNYIMKISSAYIDVKDMIQRMEALKKEPSGETHAKVYNEVKQKYNEVKEKIEVRFNDHFNSKHFPDSKNAAIIKEFEFVIEPLLKSFETQSHKDLGMVGFIDNKDISSYNDRKIQLMKEFNKLVAEGSKNYGILKLATEELKNKLDVCRNVIHSFDVRTPNFMNLYPTDIPVLAQAQHALRAAGTLVTGPQGVYASAVPTIEYNQ